MSEENPTTKAKALPIAFRGVTKTYGRVIALDNVDLDVRSGEFLTLLGPSGSGKTTLLMVLAGFIRPDSGSIKVGGEEIVRLPPHKRDLGMVFQNYALFPHMDVAANVGFPLRLRKLWKEEVRERVRTALERVKLDNLGERGVDQLSGGQRQRVALARAIVFEPRILLMDEPLSALDKKLREHMQIELRRLHDELGMTTVYVTHDQREALTMSDRVAVINHGTLMQLDEPRRMYEYPANRFVADFIGESTFIPVTVRDGACFVNGVELKSDMTADGDAPRLLLMRPERLQILHGEAPEHMNVFEATVADVVYQGETFLLYAELADGTRVSVRAVTRGDIVESIPARGARISLGLDRGDTVLVADEGVAP